MAQGNNHQQTRDQKEEDEQPMNEQQIGAEFAKAFQELARGEQTAASLEGRLDEIEKRIEQLLASAEENARQLAESKSDSGGSGQADPKPQPK